MTVSEMPPETNLVGTLVRVWENGFRTEIASEWVDWDNGWFHLKMDSPLADRLCEAAMGAKDLLLTVYSTEELVWLVDTTHIYQWGVSVHCVPYLRSVRHALASDDYLVFLWLEAEKRHGGQS